MTQAKHIEHPIPPLYDGESRILILGSFPSVKSRETAFFYGHPQNRFWRMLAAILNEDLPASVEEKADLLHRNHIAVWDTIKSCEIVGSSDSSIRSVVPNDLSVILETAPVEKIYCNGATSYRYYRKYIEPVTGRKAVKLPSTSPANAACSLDRLIDSWNVICQPLGILPNHSARVLLAWYDYHARILPWRTDPTPYRVWISEIMLQQTRVETVKAYYDRWMEELPDVRALADVSHDRLMKLWEGLGYYNRARNLQAAAKTVVEKYDGIIPSAKEDLLSLKGIGEYTAGAIASIAYGQAEPAMDGNAYRILSRLLAEKRPVKTAAARKRLEREARRILPHDRPGDFNQALMDLGSATCLANGLPLCESCPLESICLAAKEGNPQDYPVKEKKKARKKERLSVYVIRRGREVFLHKRKDRGLLAGLWEFPNEPGKRTMDQVESMLKEKGLLVKDIHSLGRRKHIFSHVEWEMEGYACQVEIRREDLLAEAGWLPVPLSALKEDYAIPSAFEGFRASIEEVE